MTADSSIAWVGPWIAPSIWLTSATAPRRSSGERAMKSRATPFAPKMRISSGPWKGSIALAAAGSAVSQPSPTASSRPKADRGQETDTTIRLSADGLRGNGLRCGAAQHAWHAIDQRVGPGKAVGIVAPEPADGPAQDLGADIFSAGKEVVGANLVHAGRHRVPLVRSAGQRLLHELVPDGSRSDDTGGVVAEGGVVRIPDPHRSRQRGGVPDRPVVAERLRGPG